MKWKIITRTSTSLTIELCNQQRYYCQDIYNVLLDGKVVKESMNTNVFSLFNLTPDTSYVLEVFCKGKSSKEIVKTKSETIAFNVKDFGAKGDGINDDTSSLQAAICATPKDGRVYIPAGEYYTKPLFLVSHITIELAKGAVLKGHTDRSVYPILPGITTNKYTNEDYYLGSWEGDPLGCYASLITGLNVNDVQIIGEGIIDGNAQNGDWWIDPKQIKTAPRPRTVFLHKCRNVTLQGVTIQNSPSWTIHPLFSSKIDLVDLKVINPKDSPNTDGCDPESCDGVKIIGVDFSVGDDCLVLKSGKYFMGMKFQTPSQNIVVRNCNMQFGHGAVVIGSEMSGGVKDITVEQCIFRETDRGLRIKTRRGRGKYAVVDGIKFSNIDMIGVITPLVINMFYFCDPDGKTEYVYSKEPLPIDERTPYVGELYFKDMNCSDVEAAAGFFAGLPEQKIKKVHIENINFSYKKDAQKHKPAMMTGAVDACKMGIYALNVEELVLNNVTFDGNDGEEIIAAEVDKVEKS